MRRAEPPRVEVEVVVARYREDPRWVGNLPPGVRVALYDKGHDLVEAAFPRARVTRLENVGVEAHTYLTHLVTRRDTLAPVTVFVQGHPFDHAPDLHKVVRALAAGREAVAAFRWLGFIVDSDDPRGRRLFVPWSKNRDRRELAVDVFHRELFGSEAPEWLRFYPGGQFVATREAVLARPAALFEKALALAGAFPDAGHCFERTWDRLFGVVGVDPALLGGGMTRYLKPIKRLAAT